MLSLYYLIVYKPLFNILILLYEVIPGHDFGIAVILLTLFVKLIFYPLGKKAFRSQKLLQQLQPKIKQIQQKYKNDREKQMIEIMNLYKKEKVNPFSGCLPLLLQLPILIALFQLFRQEISLEDLKFLYNFTPTPSFPINYSFLGIINLNHPSIFLALLTGIFQFIQSKMSFFDSSLSSKPSTSFDLSKILQKQTIYFYPFLTFFILLKLPSAIALYWLVSTIFTIFQQYIIFKKT